MHENNRISWRGYFAEVKQRQANPFSSRLQNAVNILVKMDPTKPTMYADLVLSIPQNVCNRNGKVMWNALEKCVGISFDATLTGLGNEFKIHHLCTLLMFRPMANTSNLMILWLEKAH
jgi:hypothetical protein